MNLQNCEFCGSLLIRLQHQGINIEQAGYKDDSKVFKGIEKALNRNLELQKSPNYNDDIVNDLVETSIYVEKYGIYKNYRLAEISNHSTITIDTADNNDNLIVEFNFLPDDGDELHLRKFRNLDIYKLFTEEIGWDEDVKYCTYAINFGNDAKGAAQLLSKVIHEVYSIPYETNLDCYTNRNEGIVKHLEEMSKATTESNNKEKSTWSNNNAEKSDNSANIIAWVIGVLIFIIIILVQMLSD
jgi:hypothetical protein